MNERPRYFSENNAVEKKNPVFKECYRGSQNTRGAAYMAGLSCLISSRLSVEKHIGFPSPSVRRSLRTVSVLPPL